MKKMLDPASELKAVRNDLSCFIQSYHKTPRYEDYRGKALPRCRQYYARVASDNGVNLEDIVYAVYLELYDGQFQNHYQYYVERYQAIMDAYNCTLYDVYLHSGDRELLPDSLWMIKNCPILGVTNGALWTQHYCVSSSWTKQMVIEAVKNASELSGRAIIYEDFQNRRFGLPTVRALLRHWKSINAMNDDLGIQRRRDYMSDKSIPDEDAAIDFLRVCSNICKDRPDNVLTTREINVCNSAYNSNYYRNAVKRLYGLSLPEYAKRNGYFFGNPGNGNTYAFDDGEVTESQFERIFSEFLRKENLKYGRDYIRSQTYSELIGADVGHKRCDYVVQIEGRRIVIEIAGMLSSYKKHYINDIPISKSKSKERYRRSLQFKEAILSEYDMEYFILFPCDLTERLMRAVLYDSYPDAKALLMSFNKNNIDWTRVKPEVGVTYDWLNLGKDSQPVCLCSR